MRYTVIVRKDAGYAGRENKTYSPIKREGEGEEDEDEDEDEDEEVGGGEGEE